MRLALLATSCECNEFLHIFNWVSNLFHTNTGWLFYSWVVYTKNFIAQTSRSKGCVAQLVERSLPTPEVRGSNPVIGKYLFILNICLLSTLYWKDENKEKEAGNRPFFKKKQVGLSEGYFLFHVICVFSFLPFFVILILCPFNNFT